MTSPATECSDCGMPLKPCRKRKGSRCQRCNARWIGRSPGTPEVNRRRAQARSDAVLAWCPPSYRADYRHLLYRKGIRAADARSMIKAQIAADQNRRTAGRQA